MSVQRSPHRDSVGFKPTSNLVEILAIRPSRCRVPSSTCSASARENMWDPFLSFVFFLHKNGTINAVRVCQLNHVLTPKTCTMTLTTWLANQPSREVGHPDPRVPHSLNAPMNLRTSWRKKWRGSSSIASANRRKRTPATWGRPLAPDFLPTDE